MWWINDAFAEEVSDAVPTFQNSIAGMVPLLIFAVVFYFVLLRPQQKRQREHEKEVLNLKIGDRVVTVSGVYGNVSRIKEKTLMIEVAKDVEIEVVPNMVSLHKDG